MTTSQSASIQVALGATKWALVGHKFKGTNSRPYNQPCFLISTSIALLTTQAITQIMAHNNPRSI